MLTNNFIKCLGIGWAEMMRSLLWGVDYHLAIGLEGKEAAENQPDGLVGTIIIDINHSTVDIVFLFCLLGRDLSVYVLEAFECTGNTGKIEELALFLFLFLSSSPILLTVSYLFLWHKFSKCR